MTKQELNRDIKRLSSEIYRLSFGDNTDYFSYIENEGKKEFTRLYYANKDFSGLNLQSIKIMLRLNVKHRFIPFHQFGLFIEL